MQPTYYCVAPVRCSSRPYYISSPYRTQGKALPKPPSFKAVPLSPKCCKGNMNVSELQKAIKNVYLRCVERQKKVNKAPERYISDPFLHLELDNLKIPQLFKKTRVDKFYDK